MTRDEAFAYLRLYAAVDISPTLTEDELAAVLLQSRIVDADGRRITDPGYTDNYWGTRAVTLADDAKVSKATSKVDLVADGNEISASQVIVNLSAQRRSWRARMLTGTP